MATTCCMQGEIMILSMVENQITFLVFLTTLWKYCGNKWAGLQPQETAIFISIKENFNEGFFLCDKYY